MLVIANHLRRSFRHFLKLIVAFKTAVDAFYRHGVIAKEPGENGAQPIHGIIVLSYKMHVVRAALRAGYCLFVYMLKTVYQFHGPAQLLLVYH